MAWRTQALALPVGKPKPSPCSLQSHSRADAVELPLRAKSSGPDAVFCHSYDMGKRLEIRDIKGQLHSVPALTSLSLLRDRQSSQSPFKVFLKEIRSRLQVLGPYSIHRICIPNLLSPTLYDASMCNPTEALQFLHGLRSLLRQYPTRATAMLTLPTSLYPRTSAFGRWMELLSDGVLELSPFHEDRVGADSTDTVQGLLHFHRLPVYSEKGGGSDKTQSHESLSFRLSNSSGLVIKPFSLPPIGPSTEARNESQGAGTHGHGLDF